MPLPFRIVVIQCCTAAAVAFCWALAGVERGISSALAGLVVIVPNAYFAWRVGVASGRMAALDQGRRLLGNSVVKLALGVGMLAAIFVSYRPEPLAFFVTLIAVQAVHWVAPWLDVPRRIRTRER